MSFKWISFLILFCGLSSHAEELKIITPESFVNENPSLERKAIVDFLVHQFDTKKVSQSDLDKLWSDKELRYKYMMARFQIVDQKVYADSHDVVHYYFPHLFLYFQKLVQNYKINDVDFIIYLREEMPIQEESGKRTLGIPAFMMFQNKNSAYEIDKLLFPDAFFIKLRPKNSTYAEILEVIDQARLNNAWQQKIDKVFWRGATSGGFQFYNIENFDKLPRVTSCILSKLYPDLIDAEFSTSFVQFSKDQSGDNLKEILKLLGKYNNGFLNPAEHLKYKYLLSLDGNSATGTRVAWIMYSNSILLKQESDKIQWYYSALKPYVHYVPVDERLTDILSVIEWMKAHDKELQKISQNAHNFVANDLMPEHIDKHIVILLNEYSKIQQDQQIKVTLPNSENVIPITVAIKVILGSVKFSIKRRFSGIF